MELQGKVIAVLEKRSGESARGTWEVQEYVIETAEAYPHKMVFSVFGADRISRFNIQMGQFVNVSFDIDAREYNGRWFTSIRAFDVRQVDPQNFAPVQSPQTAPVPQAADPFPPQDTSAKTAADDLPF